MAYDGGYAQQQRPYAASAGQRPGPPPRQYPPGPGPQQYDQYQDDYGYENNGYDDGYGPDYGAQYDDMTYNRGPPPNQPYPPQDHYGPGPGRGRPMPGGRGGPTQRAPTADGMRGPGPFPRGGHPPPGPGRGYLNGHPMGRGRPGPPDRTPGSDPSANRPRPPMDGGPASSMDAGGGSAFPSFPGQNRKTDLDQEHQILDKMGAMNISGQRPPHPGAKYNQGPPQRGPMRPAVDDFGRPSMESARGPPARGYPAQGFPDQRRPGPDPGYGPPRGGDFGNQEYFDDGFGQAPPPRDGFGPPARSMTGPVAPSNGYPPPRRVDTAPFAPGARGMPQRPSTAQGTRPPPQRMYPPNPGPPGPQPAPFQENNMTDPGPGWGQPPPPRPASFDDFYDSYYTDPRASNDFQQQQTPSAVSDMPDFDAIPAQNPRNSFDQHMVAGSGEQPRGGPGRVPELKAAKSQPDLRQPQAAVFEMASDIPPLPSNPYQQAYSRSSYEDPQPYPGQPIGLPSNPGAMRPGGGHPHPASPPRNAQSPGSHPAPIRPGLMPNSLVSQVQANSKPAPVRHYGGTPMNTPPAPMPQEPGAPPKAEPEPPVTPGELERLRGTVKSDPNDQATALRLARKLVEAADVLVPNLPDPRARSKARDRYAVDAHKILKKLANAQNPDAMFFLADSIGRGTFGGDPDHKEAFTLYQSSAKLGHAAAAYRTAVCCEIGSEDGGGTRKDPLKAIQWYKRAATLGDPPAMYKLGMILLKGLLGQPKNPREAVGWLKRAAERADQENPHSLHELGLLYESAQPNDAIIRDEVYAFQLFKEAADMGYKFSQFRLGCAFEYGLMQRPVDPRQSIMWYSRAATQEEHQSELALSGWYLTGADGCLQQSDTEAYLWARKAAMAGLAKAEYAMGYFTEEGIGVPANMEDAKRWYWRAAAQDFPKARERLEDLKRSGKNGPRQRERISRSRIGKQQEGECAIM